VQDGMQLRCLLAAKFFNHITPTKKKQNGAVSSATLTGALVTSRVRNVAR
jgi:hypothetical protein